MSIPLFAAATAVPTAGADLPSGGMIHVQVKSNRPEQVVILSDADDAPADSSAPSFTMRPRTSERRYLGLGQTMYRPLH